jgi:hypothetical protein
MSISHLTTVEAKDKFIPFSGLTQQCICRKIKHNRLGEKKSYGNAFNQDYKIIFLTKLLQWPYLQIRHVSQASSPFSPSNSGASFLHTL